jgi:hypothetical protein
MVRARYFLILPHQLQCVRAIKPGDWIRTFVLGSPGLCRARSRRAGRPQRSEDRTGPASQRGGRRPHLTRVRKLITA